MALWLGLLTVLGSLDYLNKCLHLQADGDSQILIPLHPEILKL